MDKITSPFQNEKSILKRKKQLMNAFTKKSYLNHIAKVKILVHLWSKMICHKRRSKEQKSKRAMQARERFEY